jgi:hypothetical protein
MPCDPDIRSQIRHILLQDWDPSNAARSEHSQGEYDGYIDPLRQMIESGASEDALVAWLHEREQESMCFPGLDTRRLHRVARSLLALLTPSKRTTP